MTSRDIFCGCARLTCMRSMESDSEQALLMRYVCSMYSVILCRKLSGSLRTMGIVIFDSSCAERKSINKHGVWISTQTSCCVKWSLGFLPGRCIFSGYSKYWHCFWKTLGLVDCPWKDTYKNDLGQEYRMITCILPQYFILCGLHIFLEEISGVKNDFFSFML